MVNSNCIATEGDLRVSKETLSLSQDPLPVTETGIQKYALRATEL